MFSSQLHNVSNYKYLLRLGTKPVPRIWDKWNFKALEPKDMRKDEQIKQDASKGDNMLALA